MSAQIERKRPGSKKVKSVSRTEIDEDGFLFMFLPFFEQWGCVDQQALSKALAQIDEMGIDVPKVGT